MKVKIDKNGGLLKFSSSWDLLDADIYVNCQRILKIEDMTGIDWTQTLHEIERAG